MQALPQAVDSRDGARQGAPAAHRGQVPWRAAMLWSLGVEGTDLLNPAYHEALLAAPRRTISAPAVGVNPAALAARFIAQQQAAAQAAAQAAQAAAAVAAMGMIPTPGLSVDTQQQLQHQAAALLLHQQQRQQNQQQR
jgi:hypothetical protein